jgi:hypothetical protein
MRDKRQIIPAAGLVAVLGAAAYMVVQLSAQTPTITGNFTSAVQAEVRDAQGQVILRGAFQPVEEEDDDVERKASLATTGVDADAAGEAEVEFSKAAAAEQEVEFSVHNVEPGAAYTFVIDGVEIGSATADTKGRAELEVDVRMK